MMPAHTDEASRQRKELVDWFMRRQGPHWSDVDEEGFQQWLAVSANQAAYARWEADWQLMASFPPAAADRLRAMVAADRRAAAAPSEGERALGRRRILSGGFALAGIGAVAVTGWLGWQHLQAQPVFEQTFATRKGQQSEARLPDGSTLRLDTATRLHATFYRDRRTLRLDEGQVMLSVTADAHRPFRLAAGPIRVSVVGTRFSVRFTPSVPGREGVEVAVEEGRVRVQGAAGASSDGADASPHAVELSAGQRLVFDTEGRQALWGAVPSEGIAAWRTPPLSFSDVPLGQAVAEMQRYGDLGIAAVDPAAAPLRLSGTFDPRDAAAARRVLAGALPIRLEHGAGGMHVRPAR